MVVPEGERACRRARAGHPGGERPLEADAPADQGRRGPGKEHQKRARQQVEAGLRGAGAEPVVDEPRRRVREPARRLHEVRQQHEGAEEREAGDQRADVRQQNWALHEDVHVDHRLGHAELGDDPGREEDRRSAEKEADPGRAPAPALALGQPEQEANEAGREQRSPEVVDSRRGLDRRLGHEPVHEHHRDRDRDRAEDEQPAPRDVVDDQAREDDSEAAADAEDGREQADPDPYLLRRKLVADDPERERKDRGAEPLHGPEEDQDPDVPGRRGADAPEQEERQRDDEQSLLPVLIAELAEDCRRLLPQALGRIHQQGHQVGVMCPMPRGLDHRPVQAPARCENTRRIDEDEL